MTKLRRYAEVIIESKKCAYGNGVFCTNKEAREKCVNSLFPKGFKRL